MRIPSSRRIPGAPSTHVPTHPWMVGGGVVGRVCALTCRLVVESIYFPVLSASTRDHTEVSSSTYAPLLRFRHSENRCSD